MSSSGLGWFGASRHGLPRLVEWLLRHSTALPRYWGCQRGGLFAPHLFITQATGSLSRSPGLGRSGLSSPCPLPPFSDTGRAAIKRQALSLNATLFRVITPPPTYYRYGNYGHNGEGMGGGVEFLPGAKSIFTR